ncbi:response regulator [Neptunomonas sp. XY-337]|uniref:response regulator n=1 Tax=Neptunomonas sp. XY-337 TaxID=2561897 RepID=UPI0010A9E81D|nr:response regulator [Neptunomonas sp. XY-337]
MANIRVVIAEDDPQIAEIQKRFLERVEGFELVGIAHGLKETRDLIEVFAPELLLLDIQFPDGTGLELLRELRAQSRNIDVILITAAKEVKTLKAALQSGIFDYILKPLVYERLQEALLNYQQHLEKLTALSALDQREVDRLLPRSHTNEPPVVSNRLPKGIDALTLEKVQQVFAAETGSLNAEEVGERIGAGRTTARRYLEYLVAEQQLLAEVSYGSVGRPERRYHSKQG